MPAAVTSTSTNPSCGSGSGTSSSSRTSGPPNSETWMAFMPPSIHRTNSAMQPARELTTKGGDLGDRGADVGGARGGDLVVQVVHVGGVVAQAGDRGQRALGVQLLELGVNVHGGVHVRQHP